MGLTSDELTSLVARGDGVAIAAAAVEMSDTERRKLSKKAAELNRLVDRFEFAPDASPYDPFSREMTDHRAHLKP